MGLGITRKHGFSYLDPLHAADSKFYQPVSVDMSSYPIAGD